MFLKNPFVSIIQTLRKWSDHWLFLYILISIFRNIYHFFMIVFTLSPYSEGHKTHINPHSYLLLSFENCSCVTDDLLWLLNTTRFAHLLAPGLEGGGLKEVCFQRYQSWKGCLSISLVRKALKVPLSSGPTWPLHFASLSCKKHRELCYSCLLWFMKRKPYINKSKNNWRLNLVVESCGKGWVENQMTCTPFSTNQGYVTANEPHFHFFITKLEQWPKECKCRDFL
jgi:hypothetical protein